MGWRSEGSDYNSDNEVMSQISSRRLRYFDDVAMNIHAGCSVTVLTWWMGTDSTGWRVIQHQVLAVVLRRPHLEK